MLPKHSAADLSDQLAQNALTLCRALLPAGRRDGSEWRVGDVSGEPGQSLAVCVQGPKVGVWRDFASDEGGDLLDLVAAVKRLSTKEAMAWAREFLNLPRDQVVNGRQQVNRAAAKPDRREEAKAIAARMKPIECTAAARYMESRSIDLRNLGPDAGVTTWTHHGNPEAALTVAARGTNGEVVAVQRVFLVGDRKATMNERRPKQTDGPAGLSVGWHVPSVAVQADRVLFVEGPEDAATAAQVTGLEAHATLGIRNFASAIIGMGDDTRQFVLVADPKGHEDAENALTAQLRKLREAGIDVLFCRHDRHDLNALLLADGADAVRSLIDSAGPPPVSQVEDAPKRRFPLVPFNDVKLNEDPAYLVEKLLPAEGLCVVWGPPKCGKTFWVMDLILHVSLGWQYRGLRVQQGHVVYISCEGARGIGQRVEAFRRSKLAEHNGRVPCDFLISPLDLASEHAELIADIKAQTTKAPTIIVIDTLNRSLAGSESSDEDMANYIRGADALRDAFGCLVLVIHHCGHDTTRLRGHSSLIGALDCQISVKRNQAEQINTLVEWMKDGAEGEKTTSVLEVVEFGRDIAGQKITSCVVRSAGNSMVKDGRRRPRGQAGKALELLENAIIDEGEVPPPSKQIPGQKRIVPLSRWRALCYAGLLVERDNERDKNDAARKAFSRASRKLQELGFVGYWEGKVWLCEENGTSGT